MADNVLLLGAGFSHAAGIPLMSAFVERIWEFGARHSFDGKPLSREDVEVFSKAMGVWSQLDGFHGRAEFDDRNIEDVLSMLSFNMLAGERGSTKKLDDINRAILRTIELTCTVTHPGVHPGPHTVTETGPDEYRAFWTSLLTRTALGYSFPSIITTNYDLVLERSLFQVLNGTRFDSVALPFDQLKVNFEYGPGGLYAVQHPTYIRMDSDATRTMAGTRLEPIEAASDEPFEIAILKLHGSLSFPRGRLDAKGQRFDPVTAQGDPLILPPISHKLASSRTEPIWRAARSRTPLPQPTSRIGAFLSWGRQS